MKSTKILDKIRKTIRLMNDDNEPFFKPIKLNKKEFKKLLEECSEFMRHDNDRFIRRTDCLIIEGVKVICNKEVKK